MKPAFGFGLPASGSQNLCCWTDRPNQSINHLAYTGRVTEKLSTFFLGDVPQPLGKSELCLALEERTTRVGQKMRELTIGETPFTFGDIARYRDCSTPNLAC